MREIKYRAKRVKDGEWIEGSFNPKYHSSKQGRRIDAIFWSDSVKTYRQEVYTSSFSVWLPTPSLNIEGVWLDSDVVEFDYVISEHDLSEHVNLRGVFTWNDTDLRVEIDIHSAEYPEYICLCFIPTEYMTNFKVIGNIIDNPELLTKTEDK